MRRSDHSFSEWCEVLLAHRQFDHVRQDEPVVNAHTLLFFAIATPFATPLAGTREQAHNNNCAKGADNPDAGGAACPAWPGMRVRERGGDGSHAMLPEQMSRAFFADAHELLPDFRKLR